MIVRLGDGALRLFAVSVHRAAELIAGPVQLPPYCPHCGAPTR